MKNFKNPALIGVFILISSLTINGETNNDSNKKTSSLASSLADATTYGVGASVLTKYLVRYAQLCTSCLPLITKRLKTNMVDFKKYPVTDVEIAICANRLDVWHYRLGNKVIPICMGLYVGASKLRQNLTESERYK